MVTVKDAVRIAQEYSGEVLGDQYVTTLEEVELSNDERRWYITLGYRSPTGGGKVAAQLEHKLGLRPTPDFYKVFEIDRETQQVRSMRIRKVG